MSRMKLNFCLLINVKCFFKVILSFYVYMARHTHITGNIKFAISLQHIKKEVGDAVDFLHADKHESLLLQIEWSSMPKVSKIASFACLYNISKKKLEMKLTFGMQINIKVSYKLISTLWISKISTR